MTSLDWLVSTQVATEVALLVFVKATALLVVALLVARGLKSRSAELRHWVWLLGLGGLLALPLAYPILPAWGETGMHYPTETPLLGSEVTTVSSEPMAASAAGDLDATFPSTSAPPSVLPLATMLLLLWWCGVVVAFVRLGADLLQVGWLRRSSRPVLGPHPAAQLLDCERVRLGISRPVALLRAGSPGLAATVGSVRPAVVLGDDVLGMSASELRSVLIHELAHVRRGDFLSNLLPSLVMPLYWPNPIFWWVRRRAAAVLERACDDEVLRRGVSPVEYATVLLRFAVTRTGLSPAMRSTMGFLRLSATGERIISVLDEKVDRRRMGRGARFLTAGLSLVLVLVLGAWSPVRHEPGTGPSTTLVEWLEHPDAAVRERAAATLGRRDPTQARARLEDLLDDPVPNVRLAAAAALYGLASPASIPAMARVLERAFDEGRGEHGYVLKLAMTTLGRVDMPEAAAVLVEQLDRPVPQLRRLALAELVRMSSFASDARQHVERFAFEDPDPANRAWAAELLEPRP